MFERDDAYSEIRTTKIDKWQMRINSKQTNKLKQLKFSLKSKDPKANWPELNVRT